MVSTVSDTAYCQKLIIFLVTSFCYCLLVSQGSAVIILTWMHDWRWLFGGKAFVWLMQVWHCISNEIEVTLTWRSSCNCLKLWIANSWKSYLFQEVHARLKRMSSCAILSHQIAINFMQIGPEMALAKSRWIWMRTLNSLWLGWYLQ